MGAVCLATKLGSSLRSQINGSLLNSIIVTDADTQAQWHYATITVSFGVTKSWSHEVLNPSRDRLKAEQHTLAIRPTARMLSRL